MEDKQIMANLPMEYYISIKLLLLILYNNIQNNLTTKADDKILFTIWIKLAWNIDMKHDHLIMADCQFIKHEL